MGRVTAADEYRRRLTDLGIKPVEPDPEMAGQAAAALGTFLNEQRAAIVAPLATAARQLDEVFAPLVKAIAPGAFFGDLIRVREYRGPKDSEALEAAARLIRRHFSRRWVFHGRRWAAGVGEAFERRMNETGKGHRTLWADLATPPLFIGARTLQEAGADPETGEEMIATVGDAYGWVRARIRELVEVDLLGRTLDAKREVLLGEMERPVPDDILETAEQRVDLLLALSRFPPDNVRLFLEYCGLEIPDTDLARRYRIPPATIRKRVSRLSKKLKGLLEAPPAGITRQGGVRGARRPRSRRAARRTPPSPGR